MSTGFQVFDPRGRVLLDDKTFNLVYGETVSVTLPLAGPPGSGYDCVGDPTSVNGSAFLAPRSGDDVTDVVDSGTVPERNGDGSEVIIGTAVRNISFPTYDPTLIVVEVPKVVGYGAMVWYMNSRTDIGIIGTEGITVKLHSFVPSNLVPDDMDASPQGMEIYDELGQVMFSTNRSNFLQNRLKLHYVTDLNYYFGGQLRTTPTVHYYPDPEPTYQPSYGDIYSSVMEMCIGGTQAGNSGNPTLLAAHPDWSGSYMIRAGWIYNGRFVHIENRGLSNWAYALCPTWSRVGWVGDPNRPDWMKVQAMRVNAAQVKSAAPEDTRRFCTQNLPVVNPQFWTFDCAGLP